MLAPRERFTLISIKYYIILLIYFKQDENGLGLPPTLDGGRAMRGDARHFPVCLITVSVKIMVAVRGWPLKFPTCADQCFTAAIVATVVTATIATITSIRDACRVALRGGPPEWLEKEGCSSTAPTSLSPPELLTSTTASRYPAFENLSVRKGHTGSNRKRKLPFLPVRVLCRRQGLPPTSVSDCTVTPSKGTPWSFLPITTPLTNLPSANAGSGVRHSAASAIAIGLRKRAKTLPRLGILLILP